MISNSIYPQEIASDYIQHGFARSKSHRRKSQRISYSSAPCGSGKTHQIANRARDLAERFEKVIILQPTRDLLEKTAAEELDQFPCTIFHRGTVEGPVAKALADYVAEVPDDIREVVMATHQVLPYIKNFANKEKWHVFIDEALQVVRYDKHEIPQTHDLITRYLTVRSVNSVYGRVRLIDGDAVAEIAKNEDDDEILETLAGTCRNLLNPYWESYVNIEQYEALKRGEGGCLALHSILKPDVLDGFASVFMASANFEDAQVFKVWGQKGVEFKPDLEFSEKLHYAEHPNGDLVTIYYVTDRQWSRKWNDTALEDGEKISDRMITAAKELFSSGRFLWHANKSVIESPFNPPAQRLPNKPHGLNMFTEYDDTVFLSSLNPTTDHFRFLRSQGIEGDEVHAFTYFSAAYQAIMRISIRDPKSQSAKRILVPCLPLAEYLHEKIYGSKLEKYDIGLIEQPRKRPGRPQRHSTNRERVAAQRQVAKEKQIQLLADQFRLRMQDRDVGNWVDDGEEDLGSRAEIGIRLCTGIGTQPLTATLYSSKFSPIPLSYLSGSIDAFVEFLHLYHDEYRPQSKEKAYLFSPAIFDPDRSTEKDRGKENILYLQHVVLDFENGVLQPETLPKLFPDVQMVVTNTFHHTKDKPRFRVILFTDEPMSVEAYDLIYNSIADKLEEAGYSVKRNGKKRKASNPINSRPSGLDWKKSAPTSLFYFPSQAQCADDGIFIEKIEGRYPLNPTTWIENTTVPLQPTLKPFQPDTPENAVDWERAQQAKDVWRTSKSRPGKANDMFFDLAFSLKCAGMNFQEIEETLLTEAQHARRSKKRLAQIPSIMSSLRTYAATWRNTGNVHSLEYNGTEMSRA
jgi:hypothetical protein